MSRYDNNRIYADYEFDDETSQFDPKGRWQGGSECFMRTFRCRVPRRLLTKAESGDDEPLQNWIERHNDDPKIWRE